MARGTRTVLTGLLMPHEQVFSALAVLLGFAYLLTTPAPATVAAVAPGWLVVAWAVGLALSGVLGLVGSWWWGNVLTGLELERMGLLLCTGSLWVIGGAIIAVSGLRSIFGLGLIVAWGVANVVRARQITRDMVLIIEMLGRDGK